MVLKDAAYCEKCGEKYTFSWCEWCKLCQIDHLKKNFTSTSGNEEIDNLIQEMQLKIDCYEDIVFEWIPYNQFSNIKETNEDSFAIAIWKDGPLKYNTSKFEYIRDQYTKVALKYLYNNEFLNEVKDF